MKKDYRNIITLTTVTLLLGLVTACGFRRSNLDEVEVTDIDGDGLISIDEIIGNVETPNRENVIRQPATIVSNPVGSGKIECAVTADKRSNDPWVYALHHSLRSINVFKPDDSGGMWAATEGNGLVLFDGGDWFHWKETEDMPYTTIKGIGVGSRVVIGGVEYPLITAENINEERIYGASILLYDSVSGSWEEILEFESDVVEPYDEYFAGLTVAEDGRVFLPLTTLEVKSENGEFSRNYTNKLGIYDGASWNYVEIPYGISGVNDAEFDPQGNYWLATQNLGVMKYDGREWTLYSASQGYLPVNSVKGIAITDDGIAWVATGAGLSLIFPDGVGKVLLREDYPLGEDPLEDITIDADQRLWILSNERVTVYNGKQWGVVWEGSANEPRDWSYNISTDSDGCIWVAESGGLSARIFHGELNLDEGDYSEIQQLSLIGTEEEG